MWKCGATYRASSIEGYSAHFADYDIDPAATSYYQDACTLNCGDVFGAYNAGEGDCLESDSSRSDCNGQCTLRDTFCDDGGICKLIAGSSCSSDSDCVDTETYECQELTCGGKCISCGFGKCINGFCRQPPPPPTIPDQAGGGSPPPAPKPVYFAGSSEVMMADGVTTKPIKDVQVGEFVRSGCQQEKIEDNAVEVVFLPHDSNNEFVAEYLVIRCRVLDTHTNIKYDGEDSFFTDMSIKTTRNHFVFALTTDETPTAIEAGTLRQGDHLVTAKGFPCTISNISSASEKGIYSLFTNSGTMIVNGLLVSSYANPYFDSNEEGSSYRNWYSHNVAHGVAMFHRMLYSIGVSGEWIRYSHDCWAGLVDSVFG